MTAHIHAENMRLYAEDALETETPWERWEFKFGCDGDWLPVTEHPVWDTRSEYRRKTKTVYIRGNKAGFRNEQ